MKHKKLFALLLTLVMLLSLMPMTVLAADAPALFMRYPDWTENGPAEDTSKEKNDTVNARPGVTESFYFYLGSGSSEKPVDAAQLSSTDESVVIVGIEPENPHLTLLEFVGFGNASIVYTEDGKEYTFPVRCLLPDTYFFSQPKVSEETYLSKFTVTDTNDTLYFVTNSGLHISMIELMDDWPEGTTITLSADKTYAAIQVGGSFSGSRWPSVHYVMEDANGNQRDNYNGLEIVNGRSSLYFHGVMYDGGKASVIEDYRYSEYYMSPGGFTVVARFGNADSWTGVDLAKLSSTDEKIVKIAQSLEDPTFIELQFVGFGEAAINYTHTDGKTYSVPVAVTLPDIAFYTKPVAAEENYIVDFHATETNDTVYLVARNGFSINNVRLEGFPEGTTVTMNTDNTAATVKMGHQSAMEWVWANFDVTTPMGDTWTDWGCGFGLTTEFPGLFFYYGVIDENGNITKDDTYAHHYWYTSPGSDHLYPMLFDGSNTVAVDPAKLTVGDTAVVKVKTSPKDPAAVRADFVGFGDTTISYTHTDGKTYALAIRVMLPEISLFSKPEAAEGNYLWSFELSETNDTMYLVAQNGFSIADAQLHRFPTGSTITMNADNTVGTIKVAHAAMEETEAVVTYSGVTPIGTVMENWMSNITMTSTIPAPECKHSWGSGKILAMPTCTAAGTKQLICALCEATKEEPIPALGHTEVIDPAVAATCTAAGKTEGKHCSVCNAVIVKQEVVPAVGHKDADGNFACDVCGAALCTEHTSAAIPGKAATCTAAGLTEGSKCSNCGKVLTEQKEIPAKGHTEVIDAAVAATCTAAGKTEGKHCSVCNEVIVKQEVVPALQHSYADGKCSICGAKDPDYVEPNPEPIENPFKDVSDTAWYVQPVLWAVQNNVTGGIGEGQFGPNVGCTRGQVVTFLWAAAGRPEPKNPDNPFTDVSESDYFYKAVLWAVENNITGGVGEGLFGPNQTCTRGQIVTFLWAAVGKPEVSGNSTFNDVADSDWYAKSVLWAAENGVTGGIGEGLFGPNETCTRGQVVTFLYKVYGTK